MTATRAVAMSRRSQRLLTARYYPGDDDATTSSSGSSLLGGQQLPFKESTGRLVGCGGGWGWDGVCWGTPSHATHWVTSQGGGCRGGLQEGARW